ncbi:MAG: hypothetical protein QXR81_00500 [Candidatus Nezhaarchaeales archaeon]
MEKRIEAVTAKGTIVGLISVAFIVVFKRRCKTLNEYFTSQLK